MGRGLFLAFCGLVLVSSVGCALGDAEVQTVLWTEVVVGAAYGAGLTVLALVRSGRLGDRPPRREMIALAGAYLGTLVVAAVVAPDADVRVALALAPLLHLIGIGGGFCAVGLGAAGLALVRVGLAPSDHPLGWRIGLRAFTLGLATVALALLPAATLDALAYDSPYETGRGTDWRLLLLGDQRLGAVVHHEVLLVVARVLAWAIVAGLVAVLAGLVAFTASRWGRVGARS